MTERLNKVLAQLGYASRRAADTLIEGGHVTVNGQVAKLGQKVEPKDKISIDGKIIERGKVRKIVVAFHKPAGVTTTRKDRFAPVTVMNYLPPSYQHLYPIGRLDKNSRGLLLFTNDGQLALKLTHPSFEHEKEYSVTLKPNKRITAIKFAQDLNRLKDEIVDPEHQTMPITIKQSDFDEATQIGKAVVVLKEGKKRQIRHMFEALEYLVTDLCRIRIGKLKLAKLEPGEYVEIDPATI